MYQIICDKHEPITCELTTSNGYKETFYQCRKCGIILTKPTQMKKEKPISKIRLVIRKAEFKKLTHGRF
jgi:ribosomal protein L37AE/L43A